MKKAVNVIRWIGVAIFGIMAVYALSEKGFLGAFLFLLGGFLIAPLTTITKLRSKLKLNKVLSIALAVVLLFGGVLATPTSEVTTDTGTDVAVSQTVSDNTSNENNAQTSSNEETTTSKNETSTSSENITSNSNNSQNTSCTHSDTYIKNTLNATCIENGYSGDTYCNYCGTIIKSGSQIEATGHSTEIRNQKSATTTSEGYTGDTYCKTCGILIKSGENIPKVEDNTQQDTNSKTVYVTETGKKYHSHKNCSGLSNANAVYESTIEDAENNGLTPCSKCH